MRLSKGVAHEGPNPVGASSFLFMVACQELTHETEREELNPNHHEKNAEQKKGPTADRCAADLVDREVDEDHGADTREAKANATEQMKRAPAVVPHKRNGDQ